jgi:hypothetical protein
MSESMKLDVNALTVGDLEDFEDFVGKPLDEAVVEKPLRDPDSGKRLTDKEGNPLSEVKVGAKALVALVWLVKRQGDPAFTVADARKVKVSELAVDFGSVPKADAPA